MIGRFWWGRRDEVRRKRIAWGFSVRKRVSRHVRYFHTKNVRGLGLGLGILLKSLSL